MGMIIITSFSVSAQTWDNFLSYKDNKIIITDNLGLGGKLVEVEKLYNTDTCFVECYTIWNVTIHQDEDDFLSLLEFKDIENKDRDLEHKFEYVSGYKDIEVNDYETICSPTLGSKNNSNTCSQIKSGSHIVKEEIWSEFNVKGKLSVGNYIIKLTGYKDWEESIDWIPTIYGQKVNQWAWWYSSQPVLYFKLDETINGTNPIDTTGIYTGDNQGSDVNYTTQGKLSNCSYINGPALANHGRIKTSWNGSVYAGDSLTIAAWIKTTNPDATDLYPVIRDYIPGGYGGYWFKIKNGGGIYASMRDDGGCTYTAFTIGNTTDAGDGNWHRYVMTRDGSSSTGSFNFYWDNMLIDSGDMSTACYFDRESDMSRLNYFSIGGTAWKSLSAGTFVDDVLVYNVSWVASDVATDWNNGDGKEADDINIPINVTVNLISPNNNSNYTYSNILNFSSINYINYGNFTNTTLYVWYSSGVEFKKNFTLLTGSYKDISQNTTNLSISGFNLTDNYLWNIYTCAINSTSTLCNFAEANYTFSWKTFLNITTNLDIPIDNIESSSVVLNFSGRNTMEGGNFTNTSVYVWFSNGTIFDTNTSNLDGNQNTTNLSISGFSIANNYLWNIYTCAINDTSTVCDFATANRTISWGSVIDAEYYNTTEYETNNQNLHINVTVGVPISSANIYYNGTKYSATVTNITGMKYQVSKDLTTPVVGHNFINDTNREFLWQIIYSSGATTNTTTRYQNTSFINFGLCNATWSTPYLNITFKDESSSAIINGTIDASSWVYYLSSASVNKTFTYSTTANYTNYTWCFNPSTKSVKTTIDQLQYSLPGYPQRRYELAETSLSSTTLDKTLYLLAAGSGIYSTYSVQTSAGTIIQDVKVTAERQIGSTWILIESGYSDSSGSVTFWLNPDYDHRITATKTGYTSFQGTIRPSSSTYTIVLATSGDTNASFTSDISGIDWVYSPAIGQISGNAYLQFRFNVTDSKGSLTGCKMQISNAKNATILNETTIGCTAHSGNLSVWVNTSFADKFHGAFYINKGSGYILLESDAAWFGLDLIAEEEQAGTLWDAINRARDLDEWGTDDVRAEYSRIVFAWFLIFIILGVITYSTGWDAINPGGMMLFVTCLIWLFSFTGFFSMDFSASDWVDKYAIAFISSMWVGGYLGATWRRDVG